MPPGQRQHGDQCLLPADRETCGVGRWSWRRTVAPSAGSAASARFWPSSGTDLNFATRPGCDGLEVIGRNQTSATLHLHATLAVSDTGLPLGVLRLGFESAHRKPRSGRRANAGLTPSPTSAFGGKTRVLTGRRTRTVRTQRRNPRVGLRSARSMTVCWAVRDPGRGRGRIGEIDGLTARPNSSRKKRRPMRRKRVAQCELRFRRVVLPANPRG